MHYTFPIRTRSNYKYYTPTEPSERQDVRRDQIRVDNTLFGVPPYNGEKNKQTNRKNKQRTYSHRSRSMRMGETRK